MTVIFYFSKAVYGFNFAEITNNLILHANSLHFLFHKSRKNEIEYQKLSIFAATLSSKFFLALGKSLFIKKNTFFSRK